MAPSKQTSVGKWRQFSKSSIQFFLLNLLYPYGVADNDDVMLLLQNLHYVTL